MSSLNFPFSFFLWFPFLIVQKPLRISSGHYFCQNKGQIWGWKTKKGNFSWAIVRENQTDGGLQVSCTDFCAKANVLYSGSSTKALRKHESSMNRTVCLSLLPAGSSSQTKFRKYMFGFNSESYDNDYFLISQTLEAAKTQDKQERVIFFVCHKRMSHLLIQCLLRNLNLDVIKLQKMQEQLGCEF